MEKAFLAGLFVLLLSLGLVIGASAWGVKDENGKSVELSELFEAKTFESSKGTTLNYRIFFPADYSPEKTYPLILFFHGNGQTADPAQPDTVNLRQLTIGICEPFKNSKSEIYNCIVLAPR